MKNDSNERGELLRGRLTRRYVLALSIVAGVLGLAFFTLTSQLQKNKSDAWLINTSGRQRMLSQRTALLAGSVMQEVLKTGQADNSTHTELSKLTALMANSHKALLFSPNGDRHVVSKVLHDLYFAEAGVDSLLTNYVDQLKAFLEATESSSIDPKLAEATLAEILSVTRDGKLLEKLDSVVSQYELEAESKLAHFWKLELAFLVFGLITLLCEALFIFRPIVNSVVESFVSLERANDELLEFSYRISHDLRAPVVSSLGLVEVTQDALHDQDIEEASESLTHIHRSLNKVSGTIEDIVNLTKLKLTDVPKESFSLEALIDDAIEMATHLVDSNQVSIQRDVQVAEPIVAKKVFVKQSIDNLISNAVKYRDPKMPDSHVAVQAKVVDGECILRVADNGLGISPEYQNRLFGMFQRFHPRVSFGSGLGLYLVRQNAAALGGHITYVSLDKGSEFELSFPTGSHSGAT